MDLTQVLLLLLVVVIGALALRHVNDDAVERDDGDAAGGRAPQAAGRAGTDLVVRAPHARQPPPMAEGAPAADTARAPHPADAADTPPSQPSVPASPATPSRPAPPTGRTRLFGLATTSHGQAITGPYAVVGYVTNGFTPMKDAIIEIAVVHTQGRGDVTDEYVTLLQPPDGQAGATFLHGLARGELALAPPLADNTADILARLDGRVVVAHHANLLEQFVDAALMAAGHSCAQPACAGHVRPGDPHLPHPKPPTHHAGRPPRDR